MKEQLISFKTAKLAKEKGFDEYCYNCYYNNGYLNTAEDNNFELFSNANVYTVAPTQSLLQKWLREVHNIYVSILPFRDNENGVELCLYYTLVQDSEELDNILFNESHLGASYYNFKTYEEALEKGLQEALKLI